MKRPVWSDETHVRESNKGLAQEQMVLCLRSLSIYVGLVCHIWHSLGQRAWTMLGNRSVDMWNQMSSRATHESEGPESALRHTSARETMDMHERKFISFICLFYRHFFMYFGLVVTYFAR